jgi:hypothetical protein
MPDPTPTPWRFQRRHYDNGAKSQGCALGHSDFEPVFLVATVECGLNWENEAEFSSACLRPRDFSDALAQKGCDASGERARSSTVFSA